MRPCHGGRLASFHAAMKRQRGAREQEQEEGIRPEFKYRVHPFSCKSIQLKLGILFIHLMYCNVLCSFSIIKGVALRKGEAGNMAEDGPLSQTAPRLQKQIDTTVAATVKQLRVRFSSLLSMLRSRCLT